MERVRVIVTFEMKEEAIPGFKEKVEKSTPLTLAEQGCISAGMYQDMENPTHFRCIEDWESYDDLQRHLTKERTASIIAESCALCQRRVTKRKY